MGTHTRRSHVTPSAPNETMRYLLTLPLLWAAGAAATTTTVSTWNALTSAVENCRARQKLFITISTSLDVPSRGRLIIPNACELTLQGSTTGANDIALDGKGSNLFTMVDAGPGVVLTVKDLTFKNSNARTMRGGAVNIIGRFEPDGVHSGFHCNMFPNDPDCQGQGSAGAQATFENCKFIGNKGVLGAGAAYVAGVATFKNCHFENNDAVQKVSIGTGDDSGAGGLYVDSDASVKLIGTTFGSNFVTGNGGASSDVYNNKGSLIYDCTGSANIQVMVNEGIGRDHNMYVLKGCETSDPPITESKFNYNNPKRMRIYRQSNVDSRCNTAPSGCADCAPIKGFYYTSASSDNPACDTELCTRASNEYFDVAVTATTNAGCSRAICDYGTQPNDDGTACVDCPTKEYFGKYYPTSGDCTVTECTKPATSVFNTFGVWKENPTSCLHGACAIGQKPKSDDSACEDCPMHKDKYYTIGGDCDTISDCTNAAKGYQYYELGVYTVDTQYCKTKKCDAVVGYKIDDESTEQCGMKKCGDTSGTYYVEGDNECTNTLKDNQVWNTTWTTEPEGCKKHCLGDMTLGADGLCSVAEAAMAAPDNTALIVGVIIGALLLLILLGLLLWFFCVHKRRRDQKDLPKMNVVLLEDHHDNGPEPEVNFNVTTAMDDYDPASETLPDYSDSARALPVYAEKDI